MICFLEYTDWDLVLEYLAERQGVDLLEVLSGEKRLSWQRIGLLSWQSLPEDLSLPETDLFGQKSSDCLLVDIENLSLKKSDEKFFAIDTSRDVYFLKGAGLGLTADEKKVWKGLKYEYLTLKKPEAITKERLLDNYLQKRSLELTTAQKTLLLKNTVSYTDLLNLLDLMYLSGRPEQVLEAGFTEEALPIFMLPFSLNNLVSHARIWHSRIGEDEVQLGLSLIYGKLEKQSGPAAKNLQQELILTDQKIKTRSKIPPLTWWKLFLWRAGR